MKFWTKMRALISKRRLERDGCGDAHFDGRAERNVSKGMSPEEARYAVRRAFGGVEQIKEEDGISGRSGG